MKNPSKLSTPDLLVVLIMACMALTEGIVSIFARHHLVFFICYTAAAVTIYFSSLKEDNNGKKDTL